ncbi:MAG: TIGR02452 family protein [Clostridiales bacterium]|nr:TIGR02452 family protein [Clostridiales bacterium]
MNRKKIAEETLKIQQQGYYDTNGARVEFAEMQKASEKNSFLIVPEEGRRLIRDMKPPERGLLAPITVVNQSTVQAVMDMSWGGERLAALNFASAKNPGGGFLSGAMAQEEALAASSGLYKTQLLHMAYYNANRACGTMMYTNHAIYSPSVVFFRDGNFELVSTIATASVLTLPAVNLGQVVLKGEDVETAKSAMKNRMRLCLAIFASQKENHLILGAYGCGVFRNDPKDVSHWWKELLIDEGYGRFFSKVVFAILDSSKTQGSITVFQNAFLQTNASDLIFS